MLEQLKANHIHGGANDLLANTAALDFGNVHVGQLEGAAIGITNTASQATDVIAAIPLNSAGFLYSSGPTYLAGGADGTIGVVFDPQAAGEYSTTLDLVQYLADGSGSVVGGQAVSLQGVGFAYADPILSATTLDLGAARVGGVLTGDLLLANGGTASAYRENLLYDLTPAPGLGATNASGSLVAGTHADIGVALDTGVAGQLATTAALYLASSGLGTSGLGNTYLGTPGVTVTGSVYQQAIAQLSAGALDLGAVHVGGSAFATLGITNVAAGALTDHLLANCGASGAGFYAGGTLDLASGQYGTVGVQFTAASTGAFTGTLDVAMASADPALADLALGSQYLAVSAAAFDYAAPIVSAATLDLGATRIGGVLAGSLTVGDGTAPTAYQESLVYSLAPAAGLTVTSASGILASGTTASLGIALSTMTAGVQSLSSTLALTSTGAGTSGLADTVLAPQTIDVKGLVFQQAIAQLGTSALNFGIVHVGDNVQRAVSVTNAATGALVDQLLGNVVGTANGFTASGSLTLSAGQASSFAVGLNTTSAGIFSGGLTLSFASHDGVLADLTLANGAVALSGTVNNYANAVIAAGAGAGSFSGGGTSYALNFGTVTLGVATTQTLSVTNAVQGPADALSGAIAALAGGSGFTNSGLGNFSGLTAGQAFSSIGIAVSATLSGSYSETLQLTAAGSNASGYSGALASQTVSVSATVIGNYTLTGAPQTITAGSGTDYFYAGANALAGFDSINAGGGPNTLVLTGTGIHNLGAPATLTGFQTVNASEQVGGQIDTLRHSMTATINVASVAGGSITIYGASNSDTINLGNGADTVQLGASTETVNGGAGTDTYLLSASVAGAAIHAGSGTNLLTYTGGGTIAMGANKTGSFQTVTLSGASATAFKFTADAQQSLAIVAATGSATIVAGNATQSVTGANAVVDVQATAAFAGVSVSTVGAGSLLEITNGGTATMNAADTVLTVKLDKAATLNMNQTGFLTAIGSATFDIIHAAAANQTLTSLAGKDTLVGYSGDGDLFTGTTAGMSGDTITNFGGSDKIDITDFAFGQTTSETIKAVGANTSVTLANGSQTIGLTLTGSFTAASLSFGTDGHAGTLIGIPGH